MGYVLQNCVALFGAHRLSPHSNMFSLTARRTEHDVSTFEGVAIGTGKSAHLWAKGAYEEEFSFQAFAGSTLDMQVLESIEDDDDPRSVAFFFGNAEAGDIALVTQGEIFTAPGIGGGTYDTPGEYTVQGRCAGDHWTAATLLLQALTTAPLETTGNGAALLIEALGAGEELIADLWLPTVPGIAGTGTPTLTVTIQSDEDEYFLYPTTRVSFTARTTTGFQRVTVDGDDVPITDTYWRAIYTISGTNPEFSPVVTMSIRDKILA